MPLTHWFGGAWGAFVSDVLNAADPAIFSRRVIADLIDGQRRGYANTDRLFALAFFELWRHEYRITPQGQASPGAGSPAATSGVESRNGSRRSRAP
jgi:hypothetical protein